jgi:hypothetical protein
MIFAECRKQIRRVPGSVDWLEAAQSAFDDSSMRMRAALPVRQWRSDRLTQIILVCRHEKIPYI